MLALQVNDSEKEVKFIFNFIKKTGAVVLNYRKTPLLTELDIKMDLSPKQIHKLFKILSIYKEGETNPPVIIMFSEKDVEIERRSAKARYLLYVSNHY
ncbi:MAG: hypothetical protein WC178_03600 [Candidatus Paceibacterota bacterium]|jgi:hypothetical protein